MTYTEIYFSQFRRWKPEIQVLAWSGASECSLPGLQAAAFILFAHGLSSLYAWKEVSFFFFLLYYQSYWMGTPCLRLHLS